MENINQWLMLGCAAEIPLYAVIAIAAMARSARDGAADREIRYQERRRALKTAHDHFQQLPFYPWEERFPRLDPFTANDQQILENAKEAFTIIQAFDSLPGTLTQPEAAPIRGLGLLLNVGENIRQLRIRSEGEKWIRTVDQYCQQIEMQSTNIEQLFRIEPTLRRSVQDAVLPLRRRIKHLSKITQVFDTPQADQVATLLSSASKVLDSMPAVLERASTAPAHKYDNGISFSAAHYTTQLAAEIVRHVEMLHAILREKERVNETVLFEQFSRLYADCLRIAERPIEADWTKLEMTRSEILEQNKRLDELKAALARQIELSDEYQRDLNALIFQVDTEIGRIDDTEAKLLPYLGAFEAYPQLWKNVTGIDAQVSSELKILRANLQGLSRTEGALKANEQNTTRFAEYQGCFNQLTAPCRGLYQKLYELQKEHTRFIEQFDPKNGTAERLLQALKRASDDCPIELRTNLSTLIGDFHLLKFELDPHPGVEYGELNEKLSARIDEGQQALKLYVERLDEQRKVAANAKANFETFHGRYKRVRNRNPRVEKNWQAIDQWVNDLSKFDPRHAGFIKIENFLLVYHSGIEVFDPELRVVEQQYWDLVERIQRIVSDCNKKRDDWLRQAAMLENSPFARMFLHASSQLREYASTNRRLMERAERVEKLNSMSDAVLTLDQIEQNAGSTYEQAKKLVMSYAAHFGDLMTKWNFYNTMRSNYVEKNASNGSGTLVLQTADGIRDIALSSHDYSTALEALLNAQKYLGQF